MGRSHSKPKKPNNPMEEEEMRKKRELKKLKEKKKRLEDLEKQMKKGRKVPRPPAAIPMPVQMPKELTKEEYNRLATKELQKQLLSNFTSFVLNQMMLSIQFLGNFESEKLSAIERCFKLENEKNQILEKHSIICPCVLDEAVEKRICFQPKHGPQKNIPSKLETQTIYVVHENVEICKHNDANYDVISPTCKVHIDLEHVGKAKKWRGYIRLKMGEKSGSRSNKSGQIGENFSTLYQRQRRISSCSTTSESSVDQPHHNGPPKLVKPQNGIYESIPLGMDMRSSSSSLTFSSTEYDYAYICSLNTHQPLSQLMDFDGSPAEVSLSVLPDYCISPVHVPLNNNRSAEIIDPDSDSDFESESDVIEVKYLNSKAFLKYFANLLKGKLANNLGLKETDMENATFKGASIFTPIYEITPALHISSWPDCAFEWQRRFRKIHINPYTGQNLQWPTNEMVKRVVTFGCHVIPLGYASKTEKNPTRELEWKVVFPKAERYLESCLSSTQVKIYMISKALIKTFVEPKQKNDVYMFSIDHLRAHLFWQCEENYVAWPEEFLGDTLIRFLTSFLNCLSNKKLPDYFVSGRNLFESIPESSLAKLHMIISQIVQNPVMHIMMAYRNIEQIDEFCPKLKLRKIYASIVVDNPLELTKRIRTCVKSNGDLEKMMDPNQIKPKTPEFVKELDDETDDQEGLIGYSNKREKFDETKRRRTKRLKRKEKVRLQKRLDAEMARRGSVESIDLEFLVAKDLGKISRPKEKIEIRSRLDNIRRIIVIETFIRHFISMAKSYCRYKSYDQAKINLNQASRLCSILRTDYGYDESAVKFMANIDRLRTSVEIYQCNESSAPPALPIRTSLDPIRAGRQNELKIASWEMANQKFHTKPETPRAVQFKEPEFIEPRAFTVEVEVYNSKNRPKFNGILKQISTESTGSESGTENRHVQLHTMKQQKRPSSIIFASDVPSEEDDYGDSTEL